MQQGQQPPPPPQMENYDGGYYRPHSQPQIQQQVHVQVQPQAQLGHQQPLVQPQLIPPPHIQFQGNTIQSTFPGTILLQHQVNDAASFSSNPNAYQYATPLLNSPDYGQSISGGHFAPLPPHHLRPPIGGQSQPAAGYQRFPQPPPPPLQPSTQSQAQAPQQQAPAQAPQHQQQEYHRYISQRGDAKNDQSLPFPPPSNLSSVTLPARAHTSPPQTQQQLSAQNAPPSIQQALTPQQHTQYLLPKTTLTYNDNSPKGKKRQLHSNKNVSRAAAMYPRKRALTACNTCRVKKTKCDNRRPICGACERSGATTCTYSSDDQNRDYSSFDPASLTILSKLDDIMREIKKPELETETLERREVKIKKEKSGEDKERETRREKDEVVVEKECIRPGCWDMSISSIFDWDSFRKRFKVSQEDIDKDNIDLVRSYDRNVYLRNFQQLTLQERLAEFSKLEEILDSNFKSIINSYFVNCYSKVPHLDVFNFFELIEIYTWIKNKLPGTSFMDLVSEDITTKIFERHKSDVKIPREALKKKVQALRNSIPMILLICALGIVSTPVSLDNFKNFKNSLEEAFARLGCLGSDKTFGNEEQEEAEAEAEEEKGEIIEEGREGTGVGKRAKKFVFGRLKIAYLLVTYAEMIRQLYPHIMMENTVTSVQYYLTLSQLYLLANCPLLAHENVTRAARNIVYVLRKEGRYDPKTGYKGVLTDNVQHNQLVDRLFWLCLKLECELNVELSPAVQPSGIAGILGIPCVIPDYKKDAYSEQVQRLGKNYDDEYTWYFYLTEVAVRKVDNKMFDDFYSINNAFKNPWIKFVKYLNQYNGIINTLPKEIRDFVLHEVNVDQIYRHIKNKYDNSKQFGNEDCDDIFESLDDFFIDDDLILRAQSDSIMFIKTRILLSKTLLFRPLVYLFLEDQIPFADVLEAIATVVGNLASNGNNGSQLQQENCNYGPFSGSPHSCTDSVTSVSASSASAPSLHGSNCFDMDMDFLGLVNAPLFYQQEHPDEDFSSLIKPTGIGSNSNTNTNTNINTSTNTNTNTNTSTNLNTNTNSNINTGARTGTTNDSNEDDDPSFVITDMKLAKRKILAILIKNLITLPKLNIPKLSTHRHPGSWYFIRNVIVGNIIQYLLYKKIQEMLVHAGANPAIQQLIATKLSAFTKSSDSSVNGTPNNPPSGAPSLENMMKMVIDQDGTKASLEHLKIVLNYWKDEMTDCEVYEKYIDKMLCDL